MPQHKIGIWDRTVPAFKLNFRIFAILKLRQVPRTDASTQTTQKNGREMNIKHGLQAKSTAFNSATF